MSNGAGCPFCEPDPTAIFHEGQRTLGLWDAFAVTKGHALLITRAHRETWFDTTAEERQELTASIQVARDAIVTRFPDVRDFNIGINIGANAGQTVFHLHVHVIPRRRGDVPDARGGVRNVIPSRRLYGKHLTSPPQLLSTGGDSPLLPLLEMELERARQLDVAVAFVMTSGVERLYPHLQDLLRRGGTFRLVTGDYLDITDPAALQALLDLGVAYPSARVDVRVFHAPGRSFHPKAYLVTSDDEGVAFVGSSNVSGSALLEGVEWNYRVVTSRDPEGFAQVRRAFDSLIEHPHVRPVDGDWLRDYAARRVVDRGPVPLPQAQDAQIEPPQAPPAPHQVQVEALDALQATRAEGFRAGLVVMATGLGKTWLAAFDAAKFNRVLFVAHREEILSQAMHTFRRVRPAATFGRFARDQRDSSADILFASIATIGKQAHLDGFGPDAFDYIVVDEFHHAAAATYRRLIDHFAPKFLLGLTATPHRTDGDDLLALCHENLVFECNVARGIELKLLSPFRYFGVADTIDYENIPWRSTRFDEEALTLAAATQERAQNALEQWRKHQGKRTLAFCVSQTHADFMREFFTNAGVSCAAVHSGASTDPRQGSLDRLASGELQVVFAVDMFNEGVDLPSIDTVMMLRPTESAIIWLQQFGRGLRRKKGGGHLTVIDYIGNHRSFLLKARTLLQVQAGNDSALHAALQRIEAGKYALPPNCSVTYELQALDIMRALLRLPRAGERDALLEYYKDFRERLGTRPTAIQAFHDGYNPRSAKPHHGSWLGFVESLDGLTPAQTRARRELGDFLAVLETTPMTKSYKMVTLLALLNANGIPGDGLEITSLVEAVQRLIRDDPRLRRDFGDASIGGRALGSLLEKNPIEAWTNGAGTSGISHFDLRAGVFRLNLSPGDSEEAAQLIREVVEWRLAEYFARSAPAANRYELKVSHANGKPILFYPSSRQGIPSGWTRLQVDGRQLEANFVRVALNVVRKPGETSNELPSILRGWFGPHAGLPGTNHSAWLTSTPSGWMLERPASQRADQLELWRAYTREQIPPLFGDQFSDAIWNSGFVIRPTENPKHMFLLVTLEKNDMTHGDYDYGDRFLAPDLFEWQSQNQNRQDDKRGRLIKNHEQAGVDVHLFVRRRKKELGVASPFVYCGPVSFESWKGNKPITVRWRLSNLTPDHLFEQFRQPLPQGGTEELDEARSRRSRPRPEAPRRRRTTS